MDLLVGSDHYPLLLRSAGNRKPIYEKGSLTWIRFGKNAVYTIWFNFLCFLLTLILSLSTPRNQVQYHRDYFLASRFCYRSFSHFFIQGTLDFLLGFFSWSSSQFKQGLFSTVPHFNLEQQFFLGQVSCDENRLHALLKLGCLPCFTVPAVLSSCAGILFGDLQQFYQLLLQMLEKGCSYFTDYLAGNMLFLWITPVLSFGLFVCGGWVFWSFFAH